MLKNFEKKTLAAALLSVRNMLVGRAKFDAKEYAETLEYIVSKTTDVADFYRPLVLDLVNVLEDNGLTVQADAVRDSVLKAKTEKTGK